MTKSQKEKLNDVIAYLGESAIAPLELLSEEVRTNKEANEIVNALTKIVDAKEILNKL